MILFGCIISLENEICDIVIKVVFSGGLMGGSGLVFLVVGN